MGQESVQGLQRQHRHAMKLGVAICLASAIGVLLLVAYCATGHPRQPHGLSVDHGGGK